MRTFHKVAVALSGGIDSAVAAILLKKKGYQVIGTFIKYWDVNDKTADDFNRDLENTRWLCDKIKIPLQEIDLVNEYWPHVFTNIIADYNIGSVPNPNIICNEHITFGCYHRYCLDELNVDAVATGHYARSSFGSFLQNYKSGQNAKLLRSGNTVDDQTYFLSRISQKALQRTMFPIGELTKNEVRAIVREHSLDRILLAERNSNIFMHPQHYKSFISQFVLDNPGRCIDIDSGDVIGEHRGLHHWSIGQCYPPNYYVVGNDEKNIVFVVSRKDHPAFYCRSLTLSYCHWINSGFGRLLRSTFQYSHNRPLINGIFVDLMDYPEGGYVFLESETPLHAVIPGQYVVLYNGDECLGSMKIMSAGPSDMFCQTEINSNARLVDQTPVLNK